MTNFPSWWLGVALWIAGTMPGLPQTADCWFSQPDQAKPPASMLLDRDALLARQPEVAQRLSNKLQALRRDLGFELYLVIQSGLDSEGADTTASILQERWVPERNGMVVVYESDSKTLGLGRPFMTDQRFDGVVSSLDMVVVLSKAVKAVDPTQPHEQLLESLIDHMTEGFRNCVKQASEPPPPGRSLRLGLFALGAGSTLALGALIVGWLVTRELRDKDLRFGFTEIDRPERLGAPFGGGVVSTRRFKN